MSDPEEDEDDMPDDQDSSTSGVVGEVDGDTREDEIEEGSDDDFFDAGDAITGDRLSSRAESESGQSGGGTEDDPVGPVTPSAAAAPMAGRTISRIKPPNAAVAVVDFSRTISADSGDLDDDEEWVDPTPIPPTPLETAPPAFPDAAMLQAPPPPPMMMAKTKSSSSTKSRKRKEARAHVPFPTSAAEEERPRRVPQMSTARGRDGGRTQSGGVKGVIAPEPGPAEADDLDGDDF